MAKHIFYYKNDKNTPASETLTAIASVAKSLSKSQKEIAKTKGIGGDVDDYLDLVEDGSIKLHLQTRILKEGIYTNLEDDNELSVFLEKFREEMVKHSLSTNANTIENINSLKDALSNSAEQTLGLKIDFSPEVLSRSVASLHKASLDIPAADKIRLYTGDNEGVYISRPETALEFDLELLSSCKEDIKEEYCTILLISPNYRSPKWKFEYKGKAISATLNDLKFYKALARNEIIPKNGDSFDVKMKILEIKKSNRRKKYRYTVHHVYARRNVILGEEEQYDP